MRVKPCDRFAAVRAAWLLAAILGMLLAAGTAALAQVNTADLSGDVLDPQGLAVAGAQVTVKNLATGATRSAKSNGDGHYQFVGLPPGRYELTIEAVKGFAKMVNPEVILMIGQSAHMDAHLQLQTGTESVTVSEATELIETARTTVSQTVSSRQIENLPINGRNYINFTLLDSQAQRDDAPSIGAAPTSGINFQGQRARSNEVTVDGADAVDNSVNGIRSTVSQEAVQEFQIQVSNYMPEFGRATGGVINIVTKSGSNDFHGNVFGFLRHKSLQARNPFSFNVDPVSGGLTPVKQPFTRVQAGATLGGPIQKDKTFFFLSFETTRRHETGFTDIGQNNFGLLPSAVPCFATPLLMTSAQATFYQNAIGAAIGGNPANCTNPGVTPLLQAAGITGASSAVARFGNLPGGPATFPLPVPGISGAVPLPTAFVGLDSLRGNYPVKEKTSLWSARLDRIWGPRNSTFVRFSVTPSFVTGIQVNAQNQNFGENSASRTSLQRFLDHTLVVQHASTLTNTLFNEARFQFARRGLHYGFSQEPGGDQVAVNITGFAFFGREPFSTVDRIERRFQWSDNLTWIKGHHTFKTGVDANVIQLRSKKQQIFELNFGGVYNFGAISSSFLGPGLPDFTAVQAYGLGLPQVYIQGIGNSNRPFGNKALAGFIQDSWKIHPRLTLNYGVRYDVEFTPLFAPDTAVNAAAQDVLHVVQGIPRDYNNVAPRVALAWDPWGDGKTVVRAGYGLFYDHPLLAVAFNSITANGAGSTQLISGGGSPSGESVFLNPTALNAASIFQGVLGGQATPGVCGGGAGIPSSFGYLCNEQRFDPKLPNSIFADQNFVTQAFPIAILPFTLPVAGDFVYASAQQGNLTVERQFAKDFKISVSYTYTHGVHENRPRDINTPDPVLLTTNYRNALAAAIPAPSTPLGVVAPAANVAATASQCGVAVIAPSALGVLNGCPGPLASLNGQFLGTAAVFNFFRPTGPNPSFAFAGIPGSGFNPAAFGGLQQLAGLAGYPVGFPGVPIPFGGVDQQESSGNSMYHGFTLSVSKRFSHHFQLLSSWTWSHSIDDSTDLQTLLEPQDDRFPHRERSNSTFDQRHRWVTSAVFESPFRRTDDGFFRKFLADFTLAPIIEASSGRPFTVLTGQDVNLNFGSNTDRPSVVAAGTPGSVESPFIPGVAFVPATTCDALVQIPPAPVPIPPASSISPPLGCTGTLGRNAFVRPNFIQFDLRVARKFYLGETANLEFITDMFNLFNRFNVGDVNPLCNPLGGAESCRAGEPTAALSTRQFQFALKLNF